MNKLKNQKQVPQSPPPPQRKKIREDYARGIPDFALGQVASDAAEGLKGYLRRYINQVSQDPVQQRKMLTTAAVVLKETEIEMKELLEDKLQQFMRQV